MEFPFDLQLFMQALLYFTVVATGLVTSIPIGVTSINFGNQCLLNAGGSWTNTTYFQFSYGGIGLCNFIVYLNVMASVLYGLGMGIYYTYAVCKRDSGIGGQMWVMPFILVNSLITILVFIASIIVSAGLTNFCNDLTSKEGTQVNKLGCGSTQNETLFHWINKKDPGNFYNGSTWHTYYSVASSAYWFCFLFWVCQTALCILRWWRNRRARSTEMFNDPATSDTAKVVTAEGSHPM